MKHPDGDDILLFEFPVAGGSADGFSGGGFIHAVGAAADTGPGLAEAVVPATGTLQLVALTVPLLAVYRAASTGLAANKVTATLRSLNSCLMVGLSLPARQVFVRKPRMDAT